MQCNQSKCIILRA